jgi:hypothetical protein
MFYERIQTKDENTYACLKTTRQAQTEKNLEANRLQRYAERQGLEMEKPKKKAVTVADMLDFYVKSGCPDKRGRLRYNPTTNTPADYREIPYWSTPWLNPASVSWASKPWTTRPTKFRRPGP